MSEGDTEAALRQLAGHINTLTRAFNESERRNTLTARIGSGSGSENTAAAAESEAKTATKWTNLFRATVIVSGLLVPMLISLTVWIVSTLFGLQKEIVVIQHQLTQFMAGPRYTETHAKADLLFLKSELGDDIQKLENEINGNFVRHTELKNILEYGNDREKNK